VTVDETLRKIDQDVWALRRGDRSDVLAALRFGWYLAEVRGRNRPGGPRPAAGQLPSRRDRALPLRMERTATELRIEAQVVLERLATDLNIDTVGVSDDGPQSQTAVIDHQARALAAEKPDTPAAATAWAALAASIYELDAHTQDVLAGRSEIQAAAYQLGRGLAEVYWALDPDAACDPQQPDSWAFLLGQARCEELSRLAGRLSSYFSPFCAPAIAGTIKLWQSVASDETWRKDAQDDLYLQLRRWYELLILGQDPSTLIKPYALLKNWHAYLRALQALRMPLAIAAISLIPLVALVTLAAKGSSSSTFLQALFGILGAVGLSAATLQARVKTMAQGLIKRLRQDTYTDLVAVAIAQAPPKPGVRSADMMIAEEVRKRTLTTTANATVP
jgi:hypothetical protein